MSEVDLEAVASTFEVLRDIVTDFVELRSLVKDIRELLMVPVLDELTSRVEDRDGESLVRDLDCVDDSVTDGDEEREDDAEREELEVLLLERDAESSCDNVTEAEGLLLPLRDWEISSVGE